MLARLSSVLAAYLLGAIPFGYLIVRWRKGIDVRETGSHSTGATNVMRNLGIAGFVATLLLDAGKGMGAVWLASRLTHQDPCWTALAAFGAITGHIFPVWLGFRGGKGVATGVGAFLLLAPVPMGLALALFAVVLAAWRYVSLGSITAAASFPVFVYLLKSTPRAIVAGAAASAVLIIARHHANIRRLINGTESRVGRGSVPGS
jgi:glycerol-3-phosphate acyltransferase PlsY